MAKSLVARLRAPTGDSVTLLVAEGRPEKFDPLYLEAANEIERLCTALQGMLKMFGNPREEEYIDWPRYRMAMNAVNRAMAALAGSADETDGCTCNLANEPSAKQHASYCPLVTEEATGEQK